MHKFLVHNEGDDVGVATQDIEAGENVTGIYMDTGASVDVVARGDIPLSHKIAIRAMDEGHEVTEYKVRVGLASKKIGVGDYVHTHNIRSARWAFQDASAKAGA